VPLEVLVNKFSHTRFDPMGHTTNPDIHIAKSLVDYIFRWLAIRFIPGYREATNGLPPKEPGEEGAEQTPSEPAATKAGGSKPGHGSAPSKSDGNGKSGSNGKTPGNGHAAGKSEANAALLELAGAAINPNEEGTQAVRRGEQFARFQSDAPSCDNCGAITVRNGNCYLCHNCGNSMGCS